MLMKKVVHRQNPGFQRVLYGFEKPGLQSLLFVRMILISFLLIFKY